MRHLMNEISNWGLSALMAGSIVALIGSIVFGLIQLAIHLGWIAVPAYAIGGAVWLSVTIYVRRYVL